MADHPHLFSPITLAGHRLKNRILFGAHTANTGEDGLPGDRPHRRHGHLRGPQAGAEPL